MRAALLAMLVMAAAPAHAARVSFRVTVPASTPADAEVWVSGDAGALGSWNGAGLKLANAGERVWTGTAELADGSAAEFKVTRGSWNTVEKGPKGEEIANRACTARDGDTVRVDVAAWRDQVEAPAAARPHTVIGFVRRHDAFPSRFVAPRNILVWLPPGYEEDDGRRYPVVYFHDGQNVFDAATSFIGVEWGADETATRLIAEGRMRPAILVGVANTAARMDEYTHAADARHGGGRSADYQRFLVEELKPFVDQRYRTKPGPDDTAVIGSSLGGLAALDLGLDHPEVFRRIGSVSTSVWWADREVLRRVAAGRGAGLRIWLDIGTAEGPPPSPGARDTRLDDQRALRDALVARGYREGVDLHYEEIEGAPHNERAWAARLDRILAWLMPAEAGKPVPAGKRRPRGR